MELRRLKMSRRREHSEMEIETLVWAEMVLVWLLARELV